MIKNEEIICFSAGDWTPPWMSQHQVMKVLCKENKVLFVEPSIFFPDYSLPKKYYKWVGEIEKEQNGLYIYTPPPVLPFKRAIPLVNCISQTWVKYFVKKATKKLGFRNPMLWIFWPTFVEMIGHFNEKLVVYYEADEMTLIPLGSNAVLNTMELKLLKKSDLVITCSDEVYKRKKDFSKNIINVPNGVDLEIFSNTLQNSNIIPNDMRSIKHPIIGFIGAIDRRFDFDLVNRIATSLPEVNFVLIGPKYVDIDKLKIKNVYYMGMKPPELVPVYINCFDVCIIPYKRNDYVKSLSPLKMLEYFAMGKPTVSVPIAEVEKYSEFLYIAGDEDAFVENIQLAINEKNSFLIEERKKIARVNTWKNKVEIISSVIEDILNKHQ